MNKTTTNNNANNTRPSCRIDNKDIAKQSESWYHTGIGSCPIETIVTHDGKQIRRVCSPIWCSVTDDSGSRICPPQWWERMAETGKK